MQFLDGAQLVETRASGIQFRWKTLLLVLVLPFLSGAAALSHELLWTRRLVDLLGATDWVIGRVLGLFFFGISVGGYLATLQANSKTPAILRLSVAEIVIALLALPAAFLPLWTDWIWTAIGTDALVSWQGMVIKTVASILVVMPPAIAMGFTLPLFIRSATDQGANVASIGVWIYAVNTLGGVFGLWLASTCLVGWLGAQGTMVFTSGINGLVALAVWRLHLSARKESQQSEHVASDRKSETANGHGQSETNSNEVQVVDSETTGSRRSLLYLSFVSGFVVLSLEILLLRLISLVVPSSYHTTSALLANVILILALSSGLISFANAFAATRNLAKNKLLVAAALFGAAIFICLCPIFLYESTDKLVSIRYLQGLNGRTIDSVGHYWTLVFWLVATSGGLALFFSGFVFPALLTISSEHDPAGANVGLLLAVNGIGGLVGTELFNLVLIGSFGIYHGFILLAVMVLVAVAAMLWNANRWLSILMSATLAVLIFVGHRTSKDLPYLSPRATNGLDVQETHFGKDGVWLIVERPSKSIGIMVNNQYFLGGSGGTISQRRQLLLPWVLQPESKSVCCLGLATGITASGLEDVENPPPVAAIELSHTVVKLAKQYFAEETNGFFERENNQVVIEDARTYVAAASNEYDLIVGDLYRPYGTGEGRLFSLEHFLNVRRALTEDGTFCQWLPIYQLNEENWLTIAATFQKAFPETLVLYAAPDAGYPVVGLMGRKSDRKWESQQLIACFDRMSPEIKERDPLMSIANEFIVGVLKEDALSDQKINTLDNLQVEISAGNFWVLKDLRKNRKQQYENELISGQHIVEFNRRTRELVEPVLPPEYFNRLEGRIRSQISNRKRK